MTNSRKRLFFYKRLDAWLVFAMLLTFFMILPIIALFWKALSADQTVLKGWMKSGILWDYTWRTVALMFGVGIGAAIIGTVMAWVVTYFSFPFKKYLEFAALLPFIMPSWIAAWCWKDILDYAGPWHNLMKHFQKWGWLKDANDKIIPIDNLWGAIFILTFTTFPYVYLLCRTSFRQQSASLFEAARSLNTSSFNAFRRISLPLVRPALAAGVLIVMMEVLNDFGTVKYFSIPVLSLAIEDAWINRSSPGAAAALSMLALFIAFFLVSGELLARGKIRHFAQNETYHNMELYHFKGLKGYGVSLLFFIPIIFGFVVPFMVMLYAALRRIDGFYNGLDGWKRILQASFTSVWLAFCAACFAVFIASLIVWSANNTKSKSVRIWVRLSGLGYAIPGIVLAAGVLIAASFFDNILSWKLSLVGSSILLVYAWGVRFLSVAIGNMDAGFSRVRSSMVDSGRSLGLSQWGVLRRVYTPLLRSFMLTAGVIVFIDSLKELPIGLLVRPFNMELLSLYVWQYGSLEQLEEAAPGALILIFFGVVPVFILWRKLSRIQPR